MIEWIIGFLVAKWWVDKEEKKQKEMEQVQFSGNIDYNGIPMDTFVTGNLSKI